MFSLTISTSTPDRLGETYSPGIIAPKYPSVIPSGRYGGVMWQAIFLFFKKKGGVESQTEGEREEGEKER